MKRKSRLFFQKGQSLVLLLVFASITLVITSAAVILMVVNASSTTKLQEGTRAFYLAEAGGENAILRLLRNPSYTGETVSLEGGIAEITVSAGDPKTILSKGTSGNFVRYIEIVVSYNNNILTIISWREVP
ncbi:MAG TPA: hypothetical protein VJH96_02090 [Patescibacteria group bacterium]|nr:hypothetical protein [Patescibacteria group bacterium]